MSWGATSDRLPLDDPGPAGTGRTWPVLPRFHDLLTSGIVIAYSEIGGREAGPRVNIARPSKIKAAALAAAQI